VGGKLLAMHGASAGPKTGLFEETERPPFLLAHGPAHNIENIDNCACAAIKHHCLSVDVSAIIIRRRRRQLLHQRRREWLKALLPSRRKLACAVILFTQSWRQTGWATVILPQRDVIFGMEIAIILFVATMLLSLVTVLILAPLAFTMTLFIFVLTQRVGCGGSENCNPGPKQITTVHLQYPSLSKILAHSSDASTIEHSMQFQVQIGFIHFVFPIQPSNSASLRVEGRLNSAISYDAVISSSFLDPHLFFFKLLGFGTIIASVMT